MIGLGGDPVAHFLREAVINIGLVHRHVAARGKQFDLFGRAVVDRSGVAEGVKVVLEERFFLEAGVLPGKSGGVLQPEITPTVLVLTTE